MITLLIGNLCSSLSINQSSNFSSKSWYGEALEFFFFKDAEPHWAMVFSMASRLAKIVAKVEVGKLNFAANLTLESFGYLATSAMMSPFSFRLSTFRLGNHSFKREKEQKN
ncbi:hypothetical protein CEXT_343801 [Caerostris extrusa]|uniref:Uncharacterized protein n=1 Tax=Caerostris extrusa TaxID=172846 RepID=A0AAV4UUP3_CAEEX|nr:hypothetical protein CEXT_343801 [Caerostris extrusa]